MLYLLVAILIGFFIAIFFLVPSGALIFSNPAQPGWFWVFVGAIVMFIAIVIKVNF